MSDFLKNKKFLITGGAGFIGSHISEYLVRNRVGLVRVLDNLSTGKIRNIEHLKNCPAFEFVEADIRNFSECRNAVKDVDFVLHHAALGSVPRSILDPLTTHSVNVDGFINILHACKEEKIKKLIFASSSSVYGDSDSLPKIENVTGRSLSPYALSKKINELYAEVYDLSYKFSTIGLRYFNVFGPRQDPEGPYAAVIPKFIKNCITSKPLEIYGDGSAERDFTYVENAVLANILALQKGRSTFEIYNVGCGYSTNIKELAQKIIQAYKSITNKNNHIEVYHLPPRPGDIAQSLASTTKIRNDLNFEPKILIDKGLHLTIQWFIEN